MSPQPQHRSLFPLAFFLLLGTLGGLASALLHQQPPTSHNAYLQHPRDQEYQHAQLAHHRAPRGLKVFQTRFESYAEQLGFGKSNDDKRADLTFDDLFADSSGYSKQLSNYKKGHKSKKGKGFHDNHIHKKASKKGHGSHGKKGHHDAHGKKYSGGHHKDHHKHHHHKEAKGKKGHKQSSKKHKNKGQKKKGFKKELKKDETGRKKTFYDDSDHQEYHIEYDSHDEYFDHHDEKDYKGAAEKALKEHAEHGEKGLSAKSKKHEHKEGDKKSHGHKEHADHHEAYDKKEGHKEAKGHSSGHGGGHGHSKGSHSVQQPVKKVVAKNTVLKPASTAVNAPAVTHLNARQSPVKQGLVINIGQRPPPVQIHKAQPQALTPQQQQHIKIQQLQQQQQHLQLLKQKQHQRAQSPKNLQRIDDVSTDQHVNHQKLTPDQREVLHQQQQYQLQQLLLMQQQQHLLHQQQQQEHERLRSAQLVRDPLQAQQARIPAPVLIYQPGDDKQSTKQGTKAPTSKQPSVFYFTDGKSLPQTNNVQTGAMQSPIPDPIKVKHLPLVSGFKQDKSNQKETLTSRTTSQPNGVVKILAQPQATYAPTTVVTVSAQPVQPTSNTYIQSEQIIQESSNINSHPIRSNALSEDDLLMFLVGPESGGYGKKVAAHPSAVQKPSSVIQSNVIKPQLNQNNQASGNAASPEQPKQIYHQEINLNTHLGASQAASLVESSASNRVPATQVVSQTPQRQTTVSASGKVSGEGDAEVTEAEFVQTSTGRDTALINEQTHVSHTAQPLYNNAPRQQQRAISLSAPVIAAQVTAQNQPSDILLPPPIQTQYMHSTPNVNTPNGAVPAVALHQVPQNQNQPPKVSQVTVQTQLPSAVQVPANPSNPVLPTFQASTKVAAVHSTAQRRADTLPQVQNAVQTPVVVLKTNAQVTLAPAVLPPPVREAADSQLMGIQVRSKGESTVAEVPILQKQRSQQVSLVVGAETLKPASTKGHGDPHGKDYHESSGAKKELHKAEGQKGSKGGKESEGYKKEHHKGHDKKKHKEFHDKGGKKHHAKEHHKSYKGHSKKGKKGKKGYKKGSKKTFKKGHKDKGCKKHHHKKVYAKKQAFYDDKAMQKHFKHHEDFDSLFDKHKKSYDTSGMFKGGKHKESFGKHKHHKKGKSGHHHKKHKDHHGKKKFFGHFQKHGHKKSHGGHHHTPKSSHHHFSNDIHHASGGHDGHHHDFSDFGSHHHQFSGSNKIENIIKDMHG